MSRGQIAVAQEAWHHRVYDHWVRKIAYNPPVTVNLCHYMRAILIFTPAYYVGYALLIVAVCLVFGLTAAVWVPIYYLVRWRGTRSVAGRLWDAVTRLGRRLDDWASRQRWIEPAISVLLLALAAAALVSVVVLLYLKAWWWPPLAVLILVSVVTAGVLVVLGIGYLHERHQEKKKARGPKAAKTPKAPKPDKGPSLTWMWIKAMKERVCPLIKVVE